MQGTARFKTMGLSMRWRNIALAVLVCTACERAVPERSNDTAVVVSPPPQPPPESTVTIVPPWDTAAGLVFIVSGPRPDRAAIVFPGLSPDADLKTAHFDLERVRGGGYDLFASGRHAGTASIEIALAPDTVADCVTWPQARLTQGPDSQAVTWSIGMARGRLTAATPDSIAAMPRADSMQVVTELARLASSAPDDTVDALRGIPYVVRRGYRLVIPGLPTVVVAEITRSLNQEANPAHEHLLVIMERDSAVTRSRLAYAERESGTEESLESTELLVAGRVTGRPDPVILIARYVGDGVVYSLLERDATSRTWSVRWNSPYAGC
jgi:hypothetical protein